MRVKSNNSCGPCLSDKIKFHIEDYHVKFPIGEIDGLWELYKEVRIEIGTKGFIWYKEEDKILSNAKTIATHLIYIWLIISGQPATQHQIATAMNTTSRAVAKYKILVNWFKEKNIDIRDITAKYREPFHQV